MNPLLRRLAEIRRRLLVRWDEFRLRVQRNNEENPDQADATNGALIGLFLFFFLLVDIVMVAERIFDQGQSSQSLVKAVMAGNPIFKYLLDWMIRPLVTILNPVNSRFLIAPLAAILIVWVAAANYLRGMFNIPTFRMALDHIFSALFFVNMSSTRISRSQRVTVPGVQNKIDIIGGPGYVEVEQDSAVLVRGPYGNLRAGSGRVLFIRNFERIVNIISTEDQHDRQEEKTLTTRDGIKLILRNMDWRYRVLPPEGENDGQRSLSNPYPMSQDALRNMTYNMSADVNGNMDWRIAVKNIVTGAVEDFVYANNLDDVTSPSFAGGDPRRRMREQAFVPGITNSLRNIGARLLWIDAGVPEIPEPDVDNSRINLWASDLMGDSEARMAYAQARASIYHEQGRAEGQAELIIGITEALNQVELGDNPEQNLRNILLFRTAQLLEAMANKEPPKELPE
ncbi:MAG TPA: hypothetical protein VFF78_03670 [Anaerolineaceae bacterium]|nr:hypothetical protein [Anaerolineaceae bacterium]